MLTSITNKLKRGGGFLLAIVLAAIIGGASTAVVMAAIPDVTGVIHGCYRNSSMGNTPKGSLRVIDSENGETCTTQETALNWNQSNGVISNRVSVSYGQGNNQLVVSIPNFGYVQVTQCDSSNGANLEYVNNTNHDVLVGFVDVAPGASLDFSDGLQPTSLLGYTSNGVNFVANLSLSDLNDPDNSICTFQAQANISRN